MSRAWNGLSLESPWTSAARATGSSRAPAAESRGRGSYRGVLGQLFGPPPGRPFGQPFPPARATVSQGARQRIFPPRDRDRVGPGGGSRRSSPGVLPRRGRRSRTHPLPGVRRCGLPCGQAGVNSLGPDVFVSTRGPEPHFLRPVDGGRRVSTGRVVHRRLLTADAVPENVNGREIARPAASFRPGSTALSPAPGDEWAAARGFDKRAASHASSSPVTTHTLCLGSRYR